MTLCPINCHYHGHSQAPILYRHLVNLHHYENELDLNFHKILIDKNGKVIATREDVGRHNALDKLVGHSHKKKLIDNHSQFIACSGRLNFELIQKGLMSNIGLMAGVGAPTSLAIDLAKRFKMTLLGFVKKNSFNIYTNKERVLF